MRQIIVRSVLLCLATALVSQPGFASPKGHQAHRSQPAHVKQSAPDITGSINKADGSSPVEPAKPAAAAAAPDVLTPYYLPATSRARMRDCGEQWRSKRMSGDTGDDDWRDFAIKCLATRTTSDTHD